MADIFLSYARADQPRVEKLASALEEAGYSLWWDRHLRGGHQFSEDIEAAIADAKAVLVVWSKDAVKSEWVRDEAAYGRDHDKLVPVRIDDTLPPLGYRQRHAIDLNGPDAMAALSLALDGHVGGSHELKRAEPLPQKRLSKAALIALPILAVVGGLGFWGWSGGWQSADGRDSAEVAAEQASDKSIAILPFRDLSPEKQEWFSEGLAQEISAALARTPDLKVAPTAESLRFTDRNQSVEVMGKALGVGHILDGSVRRSEDRIVVDIELIDVATGERLFTQRYDRPTADTITVQEDIATRIATALDTALDPEALAELIDSGTNNVEAYEYYLRGADRSLQNYEDYGTRRLNFWRQAIAADPEWSRAYAAAAGGITNMLSVARNSYTADADRQKLSAEANRYLDMAAELASTERARFAANDARYSFRGEFRRALQQSTAFTRDNPDLSVGWQAMYQAQLQLRDYKNAASTMERMLSIFGRENAPPDYLLYLYYESHNAETGVSVFRELRKNAGNEPGFLQMGHSLLLAAGHVEEAREVLNKLEGMVSDDQLASARLRQACADGDRESAETFLPLVRSPSSRWNALMLLGRTEEATRYLSQYDFADPPFALLDMTFFPNFDPSPYPNLMKIFERERIPYSASAKPRTPACPPAV